MNRVKGNGGGTTPPLTSCSMFRNRRTLWFIAMFVPFVVAVNVFPFVLAYNQWFGDRATATITECHPRGKNQNCRGAWADGDGRRRTGKIAEVGPTEVGERVPVRIGPYGVRRESTSAKVIYLALWLGFGIVPPVAGIILIRRLERRRSDAERPRRTGRTEHG